MRLTLAGPVTPEYTIDYDMATRKMHVLRHRTVQGMRYGIGKQVATTCRESNGLTMFIWLGLCMLVIWMTRDERREEVWYWTSKP